MSIVVVPATDEHLDFINLQLSDDNISRHINDDLTIGEKVQVTTSTNFLVILEDGLPVGFYLVIPQNSVTVDIHTCARKCKDKRLAGEVCENHLKNSGVICVTSHVPDYNRAALKYAENAGFSVCGYIPKSYLFKSKLIGQYIVYKNIGEVSQCP
jgi:hypothetical protein